MRISLPTQRKGFLLLEIVVAIGIAATIIIGSQTVLAHSLQTSSETVERTSAQGLLEEANAAIQSIAHDDWSRLAPSQAVQVAVVDGYWQISPGTESVLLNGITYNRAITVDSVRRSALDTSGHVTGDLVLTGGYDDPDTRKVEVQISWDSPRSGLRQVAGELLVTNWRLPLGVGPHEPLVMSADSRGMWKLDEATGKLIDSSLQGNTLTAHGILSYGVSGVSGTAVGFNAASGYADIKDSQQAGLDGMGPIVIKAYVLRNSENSQGSIIEKWGNGNDRSYRLVVTPSGKLSFEVANGSDGSRIETRPHSIPTGVWTEVMAVYTGTELQIYINGVSAATPKAYTGNIGDSDATFKIGASSSPQGFDGALDELAIYRTLSLPKN